MTLEAECTHLRAETARLSEALAAAKAQWERELIIAKAQLLATQEELESVKRRLREAELRNILAEDEVYTVREDAAKVVRHIREER